MTKHSNIAIKGLSCIQITRVRISSVFTYTHCSNTHRGHCLAKNSYICSYVVNTSDFRFVINTHTCTVHSYKFNIYHDLHNFKHIVLKHIMYIHVYHCPDCIQAK